MTEGLANIGLMTNGVRSEGAEGTNDALLAELIDRARAGDRDAFDSLMVRSQRTVVSTAWRLLGNEDDARDAAQEVFLKVYKYLHRFRRDENYWAWLYRITVNVCKDDWRKRGRHELRHVPIPGDADGSELADPTAHEGIESRIVADQRRELVMRALARLPERERQAFVLRDLEGLSTEEVAKVLGTLPVTVRSQVSMARAKISGYCQRMVKSRRGGADDEM